MMNRMSNVLVTGGSGLVGSAIVRNLHKADYDFVMYPGHSYLDLLDYGAVDKYLKDMKPDIVICAAAKVGGIGGNSRDNYGFLD